MILEGGEMAEVMGGYFIRKAVSPQVKLRILATASKPKKRYLRPTPDNNNTTTNNNNKENVNPLTGRVAGQNSAQRNRRSPLPEWYPRTPLGDISAIIKVMEKKNLLRDETCSQRPTPSPIRALHRTPIATIQMQPFTSDPMVLDLTPIKIIYTPELEAYEKKLTESIEKLEKIVKRNLKREKKKMNTPCVSKRESRVRTIMSMR